MRLLTVVRPDDNPQHDFATEILRSEGVFFSEDACSNADELDRLDRDSLVIALSGPYEYPFAAQLFEYVRQGGNALLFRPQGALASAFGLSVSRPRPNSRVRLLSGKGLPDSPEDLLCPGHTSNGLSGEGECLAELLSVHRQAAGTAILSQKIGEGRAVSLAYDPVETLIILRHGWAEYDMPPWSEYFGPRSIWAFKGLESLYSKQVPIGDVHADVMRTLIFDLLSPAGILPRLWHFPDAAKSLFFLKGDGCGESGADVEVEMAEKHNAKFTFYRPPRSRYPGELMKDWAKRGHAIAPEFDLTPVTYKETMSSVTEETVAQISGVMEEHSRSLSDECDVDFETVCFHACQWVGLPQIRMVEENDWWMPTSFISYYPGMQKKGYGIYCIPSFMPMRYYDPEGGLCRMIYAPAAWDESQSLGEPSLRQAGMTSDEYVAVFERVMTESVERYHLPHIATFHPCYLVYDPRDPRYSRAAAEGFLSICERLSVPRLSIEEWCRFIRDRWSVTVEILSASPERTAVGLSSTRGVRGLTIFLSDATASTQVELNSRPVNVSVDRFEGHEQRYVVIDLAVGTKAELLVAR